MKIFLSFVIALLLSGCTLTNKNQQTTAKTKAQDTKASLSKKVTKPIVTKKPDNKEEHFYSDLNLTIIDTADQLFNSTFNKKSSIRVILTTFVDLNELDETSTFGRLFSESMFNELHIRKFQVTDFRGRDAVTVNEDGEFHITRDVVELKDNIDAVEYILVGTYVKFEDQSLLINARILDSESGRVESSARVIYRFL